MNRFNSALKKAAIGLVAATALAACGTGQYSQTADQAAAVNGSAADVGDLALRDVQIQAVQSGDALEPGDTVDLVFVVTNQSTQTPDELTEITSPIGKVSPLTGAKTVPVDGVLVVGTPAGPDLPTAPAAKALPEVADANTASATVTLDQEIRNGLTYEFTFNFKNAGKVSLQVPISAGPVSHHH
ncbi:hypothetical protein MU0083_003496 [[Mycobacterium] kokjensenii]|uniref:Lipoprotein LpqE n=1 Tax=[Mycobacterium] kokjensenii TaxID=3064287 RepID=A0ABN9NDR5_9MYCO|nr:hypothetical protein [Mycolicibacter sp. MU0083]CAJ1504675.1 hypothetical protein MU0083_003496 [Mycolicibacter sp. MU0083]